MNSDIQVITVSANRSPQTYKEPRNWFQGTPKNPVLRIHDILGWIRIRIRGSMPLTNGSGFGSGSCYFRHWPSRCQQKTYFLTQFFSAYYILKVHLHHFSKLKSQKESQNSRNQGFSYYFCMMIEGSGSGYLWLVDPDPDPWGPNTCGSGSATLEKSLPDIIVKFCPFDVIFNPLNKKIPCHNCTFFKSYMRETV
jgi:hypothetical protein